MTFSHPWGLLAFASVPVILLLYLFRSRKKTLRVGGLHLWRFAPARMPAGGRLAKHLKDLSLLFAILAAACASLLIAGADVPLAETRRHLVAILDDSMSMRAVSGESSASRAKMAVKDLGRAGGLFTLIAAGVRPRILAGPMADWKETARAMESWEPSAPSCSLEAAADLAGKFLAPGRKALFFTDDPESAGGLSEVASVTGVGRPLSNTAILFADRLRTESGPDRVFAVVGLFGTAPAATVLTLSLDGQEAAKKMIRLKPGKTLTISLDVPLTDKAAVLTLSDDALFEDNRAVLAPARPGVIRVAQKGLDKAEKSIRRAVLSAPFSVFVDDPAKAELVFTGIRDFEGVLSGKPGAAPEDEGFPRAAVLCFLPSDTERSGAASMVQGRDVILDRRSLLLETLDPGDVMWPFLTTGKPSASLTALAFAGNQPLVLTREEEGAPREVFVNILWDRSNFFRTPAWPILVYGLMEEARKSLPGVDGANFRAGQIIPVNPEKGGEKNARLRLFKEGRPVPYLDGKGEGARVLSGLPPGLYTLLNEKGVEISRFSVNLFAPEESDLRALSSTAPPGADAGFQTARKAGENRLFYYLILGLLLLFTAASWILADSSR